MGDIFSELAPASYAGLVFPVVMTTLKTSSVVARHQFPHRPGVRLEYMGREPVLGSMTAMMFNSLAFEKKLPQDLWPQTMQLLRGLAQEQVSYPLVIPTIGTLPLAHISITERYDPLKRDGCFVDIEFVEDNEDLISQLEITSARARVEELSNELQDLNTSQALLRLKILLIEDKLALSSSGYVDIATAISGLVYQLQQANESLTRPFNQARQITNAMRDLVATTAALGDPENWQVRNAILDLQDAIDQLIRETAGAGRTIVRYLTPAPTNIMNIAITTKNTVADILSLNDLSDPTKIPGGKTLLVFAR